MDRAELIKNIALRKRKFAASRCATALGIHSSPRYEICFVKSHAKFPAFLFPFSFLFRVIVRPDSKTRAGSGGCLNIPKRKLSFFPSVFHATLSQLEFRRGKSNSRIFFFLSSFRFFSFCFFLLSRRWPRPRLGNRWRGGSLLRATANAWSLRPFPREK